MHLSWTPTKPTTALIPHTSSFFCSINLPFNRDRRLFHRIFTNHSSLIKVIQLLRFVATSGSNLASRDLAVLFAPTQTCLFTKACPICEREKEKNLLLLFIVYNISRFFKRFLYTLFCFSLVLRGFAMPVRQSLWRKLSAILVTWYICR